jgi:hypothetical protein
MAKQDYFFVRVNGDTAHNNPGKAQCYVRNEPPTWPETFFNYVELCLNRGFVRIGWPASGDLRRLQQIPDRTPCYSLEPHIRSYLDQFRSIRPGSVVLMPEKDRPGVLYIGETTSTYHYSTDVPYECAHRLNVKWDRRDGQFAEYDARALRIPIRGGFWTRAFHDLSRWHDQGLTARIDAARRNTD